MTAFELVYDKIPATLIADSAASALMKEGRVDAVIVGADRIAANGMPDNAKTLYLCHSLKVFSCWLFLTRILWLFKVTRQTRSEHTR